MDELEDIMFLNTGYRARGFAEPVTPCTSEGVEGFITAAQWLRLAFHDMGTANVFTGVGGLDASIVFEMSEGTNNSPGLSVSLEQLAPYLSSRSSMSDLIALSVYTSVRGCGGPVVPIRTGRIDATATGPLPDVFLPQPQNSFFTFVSQFQRIGFNTSQMIAVTACGHTLGQVHSSTFPQIATAGPKPLDLTPAVFDEKVASEYLAGTTPDLLVVGPSGFDSDLRVFAGDGNVTIQSMATPAGFNSMCSTVLQQMIEVVPSGVTLTDPIVPYDVKPSALQLTLLNGGAAFSFTGQIRIRTTTLPASQIASVQLVYMDRNGGSQCGSGGCTISSSNAGSSAGFDDSFIVSFILLRVLK
jgi:Peroxidase